MPVGVDVPEILVILRDMLLLLDPFEVEGIFRKAGNETEMKKMIKALNKGKPIHSTNVHSVATLLRVYTIRTNQCTLTNLLCDLEMVQGHSEANLCTYT